MSNFGPIHKLIVHKVGGSSTPYDTSEFKDFEIEHPPECKTMGEEYTCAIEFNIQQAGLRFNLQYVNTPVTQPGEYSIQAWSETYRGFDYTEYDGGITLVNLPYSP